MPTKGFAMQSFFIGIGAYVASKLPLILTYFGVANTAPEGIIPDSVKYSFYIGGAAFFIAVLWTVIKSKEYSPEEMKAFEDAREDEFVKEELSNEWYATNGKAHLLRGFIITVVGLVATYAVYHFELKKDLYVLTLGLITLGGLALIVSGLFQKNGNFKNGFVTIINDFHNMPKVMKQLAVKRAWFCGDTVDDMQAGSAAGCVCIGIGATSIEVFRANIRISVISDLICKSAPKLIADSMMNLFRFPSFFEYKRFY